MELEMSINGVTSSDKVSPQAVTVVTPASAPATPVSDSAFTSLRAPSTAIETVDKVTLQNTLQKSADELAAEKKAAQEKNKGSKNVSSRSVSDVLFDYNSKGDLRIKFMDSGNKLIYQTPPVMFAKITDLMYQSQRTVDTKA
jgi:hypothetical protein